MQLINKGFRFINNGFIMCYSKYACVILLKHKRALQLLMLFKHFSMNHKANQIEYGLTKAVNFITDQ